MAPKRKSTDGQLAVVDGVTAKPCVGCGYCCRKAPCVAGQRIYGAGITSCPALCWTGTQYRCDLVMTPGAIADRYREELYIGAGCCSPLNSDRLAIPPPAAPAAPLPHELRVVLRALMRALIGSDAIHLILMAAEQELGQPGFHDRCWRYMREHRSSFVERFMG